MQFEKRLIRTSRPPLNATATHMSKASRMRPTMTGCAGISCASVLCYGSFGSKTNRAHVASRSCGLKANRIHACPAISQVEGRKRTDPLSLARSRTEPLSPATCGIRTGSSTCRPTRKRGAPWLLPTRKTRLPCIASHVEARRTTTSSPRATAAPTAAAPRA